MIRNIAAAIVLAAGIAGGISEARVASQGPTEVASPGDRQGIARGADRSSRGARKQWKSTRKAMVRQRGWKTPRTIAGYARNIAQNRPSGSLKAEAGLDGSLRGEIARLRGLYGHSAVRVIGGAVYRNVAGTKMLSCHAGGHAFDGYLSAAAMADLRRTSFGIITYSGHHNHVHVSSCPRERGIRAHNGGGRVFSAKKRGPRRR